MLSLVTSLLGCSQYSLNLSKEDTAVPETAPPIPVEIPYSFSEIVAPCSVDYTVCGIDSTTSLYQADCTSFIDSFLTAANEPTEGSDHTILVINGELSDAVDHQVELSAIIYGTGDLQELFHQLTVHQDPFWPSLGIDLANYPSNNGINELPLDLCASNTDTQRIDNPPRLQFSSGTGLPSSGYFPNPPSEIYQDCTETSFLLGYSNTGRDFSELNCLEDDDCLSTAACAVHADKIDTIETLASALVTKEFEGTTGYDGSELTMFAGVYFCNESGECSGY